MSSTVTATTAATLVAAVSDPGLNEALALFALLGLGAMLVGLEVVGASQSVGGRRLHRGFTIGAVPPAYRSQRDPLSLEVQPCQPS